MYRRLIGALLILALIGAGLLIGYRVLRPTPGPPLAVIVEHGVLVEVGLERSWLGALVLVARYSPEEPGAHLYAAEMPREGVGGVGRPTLIEVPPQPGLRAVGSLYADRTPLNQQLAGLSAPLPIYPDGPVTLRLPVAGAGGPATLSVTYMACSSAGYCLPPVVGRELTVVIPSE